MKRKVIFNTSRSNIPKNERVLNKKRNGISHQYPEKEEEKEQEKTLLNYFSVSSIHKSLIHKNSCSNNNNQVLLQKKMNNKFHLMASPSKIQKSKIDTSAINLFNDNDIITISHLINISIIPHFKSIFTKFPNGNSFNFSDKNYADFIEENLNNIIIKYLLIQYDDLVYIPKNYLKNNQILDKNILPLIAGFDNSKNISLKYNPINIKESTLYYPSLCENFIKYIKMFKKNKKFDKPQKSLILYKSGSEYIKYIKIIETLCDNLGYQIIRLDELENMKKEKLEKTAEATKSQRISSVNKDLIQKINYIDNMINDQRWKRVIYDIINEVDEDDSNLVSIVNNTHISLNLNLIGKTFDNNNNNNNKNNQTLEYKLFDNFKNNIFSISHQKKTFILIEDSFANDDENNHLYFKDILTKVSNTKCPICILTNNLSFFAESFSNSVNFSLYKIENEGFNIKENIIYTITLIIFLHLYINKSNSNNIDSIIEQFNYIMTDEMKEIFQPQLFDRIVHISIIIIIIKNFQLDEILIFLSQLFNIVKDVNINKKLSSLEEYINTQYNIINNNDSSNSKINECNNNIVDLNVKYDEMSYNDYIQGKIELISQRRFNNLTKGRKNNDIINIEKKSIESLYYKSLNQKINSKVLLTESTLYLNNKNISRLNKEDKSFFLYYLIKHQFIHQKEICIYIELLNNMNIKMSIENIMRILNIRKTRHTQHDKTSLINKLLPRCSKEQISLYYSIHTFDNYFFSYYNHIYPIKKNIKYFTDNVLYEQILFYQNQNDKNSDDTISNDYTDDLNSTNSLQYEDNNNRI